MLAYKSRDLLTRLIRSAIWLPFIKCPQDPSGCQSIDHWLVVAPRVLQELAWHNGKFDVASERYMTVKGQLNRRSALIRPIAANRGQRCYPQERARTGLMICQRRLDILTKLSVVVGRATSEGPSDQT